jgi:hypothetical protein
MAFSPCSNYLVTVGTVHDQCIIVYKYTQKNGWVKVSAAKFKDIIDAVVWSKRRIITVGRRHLRVWEWQEDSVTAFSDAIPNDSLPAMFTYCRIGMYCIVILMTMPSFLLPLQWKEIPWLLLREVDWFIYSMPLRGKSEM